MKRDKTIQVTVTEEEKTRFFIEVIHKHFKDSGEIITASEYIRRFFLLPLLNGANPANNKDSPKESIQETTQEERRNPFDFEDMELE